MRSPGSQDSPASGPASAAARCLNCSVVSAPSAKQALTAASSATSCGAASCPAAARKISPAPARDANACSSIAPAYRDRTVTGSAGCCPSPAGGTGPGGTGPAGPGRLPGSGTAASASCGSGSACGSRSCTCTRPSRRSTVDWFTPSRRAISASRTPAARHSRARSHAASPVPRGRPAGRTSAAVPSRSARWCSVATYAALSPSTAATSLPGNFSCRSTAAATCRIAVSSAANRNSSADPAKIAVSPPVSSRRRSRGSGMPSRMAAAADIRSGYHDLTYYAKKYRQLPQLKCPSSGDLGPRRGNAPGLPDEVFFSIIQKKVLTPGDFPVWHPQPRPARLHAPLQPHRPAVQLGILWR